MFNTNDNHGYIYAIIYERENAEEKFSHLIAGVQTTSSTTTRANWKNNVGEGLIA